MNNIIAIIKNNKNYYPKNVPFRPDTDYPEYLFKGELSIEENHVYEMVREGFRLMGYDGQNFGKNQWNPLGELILKGHSVVIKPNLVRDVNHSGETTDCLYTQPCVVAAVIDYVLIALQGEGRIIIGDSPVQDCNFENLIDSSGYGDMIKWYKSKIANGIQIELKDFRELVSMPTKGVMKSTSIGDKGKVIDLKTDSEFYGKEKKYFENIRITNYDPSILKSHHNLKKHEYCVSYDVLQADVFINIPKPKTHRKAGVTISLKNIVGICTRKECLPHHTNGSLNEGGDEYLNPSFLKSLNNRLCDKKNYLMQTQKAYLTARVIGKIVSLNNHIIRIVKSKEYEEGNWHGNDTICRTIVDLNKILLYADKNGCMTTQKQRKSLIVADMIISGQKEGPLIPSPKEVGIIAIGENSVQFDEAIGTIMGAKIDAISTIQYAKRVTGSYKFTKTDNIELRSNVAEYNNKSIADIEKSAILNFVPSDGWKEGFCK